MSMNVQEKRGLYDEFKKSGIKVASFARKRGIAKTTMQRLVKDYEAGKFDTVHARGEAKRVRISHYSYSDKNNVDCCLDADGVDADAITARVYADDDADIIESDIIDSFEKAQNSSSAVEENDSDEDDDDHEDEEVISYAEAAACMATLQTYCHYKGVKMPTTLLAKADSVFNQIRSHHHTSKDATCSQQRMKSFFTGLS